MGKFWVWAAKWRVSRCCMSGLLVFCLVIAGACSGSIPTPVGEVLYPAVAASRPALLEFGGILTLGRLAVALQRGYRIRLVYPADHGEDPVALGSQLTVRQLLDLLERQLLCQVDEVGENVYLLKFEFVENGRFQLIVPNLVADPAVVPGARVVGGRLLVEGDLRDLPRMRELLTVLFEPRRVARFRMVVVDESKTVGVNVRLDAGSPAVPFASLFRVDSGFTVLVDLFRRHGAVVDTYETWLSDGEIIHYVDKVVRDTEKYDVLPQTGNGTRVSTGFVSRDAGFSLDGKAAQVGSFWRVNGMVKVSAFVTDAERSEREGQFSLDMREGECVRLVSFASAAAKSELGVRADLPGLSGEKSRAKFVIWASLEKVR
jgi:hypothetical protein